MSAIDAGTCPRVSSNGVCATSQTNDGGTTGYYTEFVYKGNRVIVSSGTPDHAAETNENKNPNFRCTQPAMIVFFFSFIITAWLPPLGERWTYATLPLNPTADRAALEGFALGTIGYATSGAVFYDHRAGPDGTLAEYAEFDTLDYTLGHSDRDKQYHYHGVSCRICHRGNASVCHSTPVFLCLGSNCNPRSQ